MSDVSEVIDQFRGEYGFLSNFYVHKFRYKNKTWRSAEHAFQASKTLNKTEALLIKRAPTPNRAKSLGRSCSLRSDWDLVKVKMMEEILRAKFADPMLAHALAATFPAKLIEGNYWGDTFWGVCEGRGHNHLGKLLMLVRDDILAQ